MQPYRGKCSKLATGDWQAKRNTVLFKYSLYLALGSHGFQRVSRLINWGRFAVRFFGLRAFKPRLRL